MNHPDSFHTKTTLPLGGAPRTIFSLKKLKDQEAVNRLPMSLKILLENLLRQEDGVAVRREDIDALLAWNPAAAPDAEISFMPARVLLQDFTGVPCAVDLAVMRDAMVRMGGDPKKINPLQPVDLVIDHSVQVDQYGSAGAFLFNAEREFERNQERYAFLRWSQQALSRFRVVPPDTGIVHQINLEYLASVVFTRTEGAESFAYPDTLVGTDSHTTMINGLGVLGWGVGGIEAEAAMLGQPVSMLIPNVVGFKLSGTLPAGTTATDLVLTVTQMLRKKGVVGKFVEFYGDGLASLTLADRATIANMAPEYGATMGYFPIDQETMNYLRFTGRSDDQVRLVEAYCKEQGLFRMPESPVPQFSDHLSLELSSVLPSIAGPKRPQDRVLLSESKEAFSGALAGLLESRRSGARAQEEGATASARVTYNGADFRIGHGSIVIAAITSCTNTSNPSVLIAAGLLARKAVEKGLRSKPWVKTSLAPGSTVVTEYLNEAKLSGALDALGFNLVGYGCTTCIGNSGPLPEPIAAAITEHDLVAVSVLSGNRNFEGRVNPHVRANYLASPPLVVAYALAGTMEISFERDPIGIDRGGQPVYLKDIWPSAAEIESTMKTCVKSDMFRKQYANVFAGDAHWQGLKIPAGDRYEWQPDSTYIKAAPYFDGMPAEPAAIRDITGARVLAVLGDSVTTDHISPAGSISLKSPAAKYLISHGVEPKDFNSYGARRGNHEVMVRGTFANIRLRNLLAPGTEGGWTVHPLVSEPLSIFDAAMKYAEERTPLLIIAGKEYGSGSSRDWAAKGPRLLGVKAVIAESFERIHRSNLVGMGVLPLQFEDGQTRESLGLTGFETYAVEGIAGAMHPRKKLAVRVTDLQGKERTFAVLCRIDTPMEVDYYRNDGILQYVLRSLLKK